MPRHTRLECGEPGYLWSGCPLILSPPPNFGGFRCYSRTARYFTVSIPLFPHRTVIILRLLTSSSYLHSLTHCHSAKYGCALVPCYFTTSSRACCRLQS